MRSTALRRRRTIARLRLRRGVFLLPSLLTTANIFCGFVSIVVAFEGEFRTAAILIILAGLLDGLDGRIARLMGGASEFGGEFDSLADVVSFGLAPAFVAHVWGLVPLKRYGWVVAFLFLVCGAIRLARFNIQHGASDRRWFVGLPIPMAAAAVAGCVLAFRRPILDRRLSWVFAIVVVAIALLMVSRFRYRSFKDIDLASSRPFRSVLLIVAVFAGIALNYKIACLVIAGTYVASAPVLSLVSMRSRGRRGVSPGPIAGSGPESRDPGQGETGTDAASRAREVPFHAG